MDDVERLLDPHEEPHQGNSRYNMNFPSIADKSAAEIDDLSDQILTPCGGG